MRQTDRHREYAVTAIRADGRRVQVKIRNENVAVSILGTIEHFVLSIVALITGSRRESGG